jgi:hypothetical protein
MFGEQRSRLALPRTLAAALLAASALGVAATQAGAQIPPPPPDPSQFPDCQRAVAYDPGQFTDSTAIDNGFLPLVPGTQLVLSGQANRTGELLPHTVTFTVTDLVKVIDGVPNRVMWDVDQNEGEIVEAELAFFAQDNTGNVWNFGEYPEEFEDGFFLGAPNTWIAGIAAAEPGIHMLTSPNVNDSYLQGFAPTVEFLDCATVFAENLDTCVETVPPQCFSGVLLTHERSPLDPAGGIQTKFHAPGVGIVEVGAVDDPEGETLVLTDVNQLDQVQMNCVRKEALRLDRRGYRVSEVYSQTQPIESNLPEECPDPPLGGSAPPQMAPAAPPASQKPRAKRKPCNAKRSRRSARRKARPVTTSSGVRVLVNKLPRRARKCAERISRR